MNELRYQLELLKATNQKLTNRDRMHTLIFDTSQNAYLHYSFETNQLVSLGRWDRFFNFAPEVWNDIAKIIEDRNGKPIKMKALYAPDLLTEARRIESVGKWIVAMKDEARRDLQAPPKTW
ncbi:MAG: hypothetical protein LBM60_04965 [Clostridium sp.]|jgi:hypothetical protein|nr:hypothetical protein [Clostridium sp.]